VLVGEGVAVRNRWGITLGSFIHLSLEFKVP